MTTILTRTVAIPSDFTIILYDPQGYGPEVHLQVSRNALMDCSPFLRRELTEKWKGCEKRAKIELFDVEVEAWLILMNILHSKQVVLGLKVSLPVLSVIFRLSENFRTQDLTYRYTKDWLMAPPPDASYRELLSGVWMSWTLTPYELKPFYIGSEPFLVPSPRPDEDKRSYFKEYSARLMESAPNVLGPGKMIPFHLIEALNHGRIDALKSIFAQVTQVLTALRRDLTLCTGWCRYGKHNVLTEQLAEHNLLDRVAPYEGLSVRGVVETLKSFHGPDWTQVSRTSEHDCSEEGFIEVFSRLTGEVEGLDLSKFS
ncbi:hypothetical protein BJX61DRAFT_538846 [Aspergillus egyptiacus]|nr:hypothetical protein BJX61DRAFT_538846 [Aspergillus egyptiacus]